MWAIYRKISPNKIFGNSTSYLRGTCNIYTYNKTGKTKGFAFKRVLAHVVNKLIKLDGITYYELRVGEVTSTRKRTNSNTSNESQRSSVVVTNHT